jgi:hypothetical protein
MMKRIPAALAFMALAVGCANDLTVPNTNQPDIERALARPGDVETAIGGTLRLIHQTTVGGSNDNIDNQLKSFALESYSTVNNFGMNVRAPVPRASAVQGEPGNTTSIGNNRDFSQQQVQARSTANYIAALDRLQGASTAPILGNVGRFNAARAFGFFTLGLAQGNVALVYDRGAITSPYLPVAPAPDLSGYEDLMAHAIAMLDTAVAIAMATPAGEVANFLIPYSWTRSTQHTAGMSRDHFVGLVRGFRARLRANVARSKAQREGADWAAIVRDAMASETALPNGYMIDLSNTAGWGHAWINNQYRFAGWHMLSYHFIGMADTSGGYQTWLNTGAQNLGGGEFVILTPDLRYPRGATRAAQILNSPTSAGTAAPPSGRLYFRNRPVGQDGVTPVHGYSYYDHARFYSIFLNADNAGSWPSLSRTELDMLAAEGILLRGGIAAGDGAPAYPVSEALRLINKTRTTSGLAPLTGTGPAPDCVPRVPTGPATGPWTAVCGDAREAMKYEKRLETMITGYSVWFFDSRGWGDLPEFTPLWFPVPWQELDVRVLPYYNVGGPTKPVCAGSAVPPACESAPRSTYGAW